MAEKKDSEILPKIAVFKGKEIRKTIHNNEWWFVVNDVVYALTETPIQGLHPENARPGRRTRQRVGTNCHPPFDSNFRRETES